MGQNFKPGDRVVFTDKDLHGYFPEYFPPAGTVGRVDGLYGDSDVWVQWPKSSTSDDGLWITPCDLLEPVQKPADPVWSRLCSLFRKNKK